MFWQRSPKAPYSINDDLTIDINAKSPAEAKEAIAGLKLEKKELAVARRQVNADLKLLRTAHRNENVARGPAIPGGGGLGRWIRAGQATKKYNARNRQVAELAPLEQRKANIERLVTNIDAAIVRLERIAQASRKV